MSAAFTQNLRQDHVLNVTRIERHLGRVEAAPEYAQHSYDVSDREIMSAESLVGTAASVISELQQAIQKLEGTINALRADNSELKKTNVSMRNEVVSLQQDFRHIEDRAERAEQLANDYKVRLKESEASADRATAGLARLMQSIDGLLGFTKAI